MSARRRLLHSVAFFVFAFAFYSIGYFVIEGWRPQYLDAPETIDGRSLAFGIALFTGIIMLSYAGANAVATGRISADPWSSEGRRWRGPQRYERNAARGNAPVIDAEFEEAKRPRRRPRPSGQGGSETGRSNQRRRQGRRRPEKGAE